MLTPSFELKCASADTCEFLTLATNGVKNFSYTGGSQGVILTKAGYYKLETWGAQGGSAKIDAYTDTATGGYGGYNSGTIYLDAYDVLFAYVGGAGTSSIWNINLGSYGGGYNGGGNTKGQYTSNVRSWGAGGGATDFRLAGGTWSDFDSLKSRIMVAAGGGGAFIDSYSISLNMNCDGGAGGGVAGSDGNYCYTSDRSTIGYWYPGYGGTQTTPGYYYNDYGTVTRYVDFGGAIKYTANPLNNCSAGGGGGWYGGGFSNHVASAAGGSSFVAGCSGCNAINTSTSTSSNIVHTGSSTVSYGGRSYSFSSITMTSGARSGNGYARITYLGANA